MLLQKLPKKVNFPELIQPCFYIFQVKRSADYDASDIVSKKPRLEDSHVQKVREKLAARLNAPKESTVTVTDNIK